METRMEAPKEIVVVGMSRSLTLMIISTMSFICLSVVFTSLLLWKFDTLITSLVGGAVALSFFAANFMTHRYFAEQSIVYNAMNIHLKDRKE